jgi:hypothetical protein
MAPHAASAAIVIGSDKKYDCDDSPEKKNEED